MGPIKKEKQLRFLKLENVLSHHQQIQASEAGLMIQ